MKYSNPLLDLFIILIGIIFIGLDLYKYKVSQTDDLTMVSGTVRNFSFVDNTGLRPPAYRYYIYMNEYANEFQIGANCVEWFDRSAFEQSIRQGDTLKLYIAKHDYPKMGSMKKVKVFGIEDKTQEFLNPDSALREYNSKLVLVCGVVFVGTGLFLLYVDMKRRRRRIIRS